MKFRMNLSNKGSQLRFSSNLLYILSDFLLICLQIIFKLLCSRKWVAMSKSSVLSYHLAAGLEDCQRKESNFMTYQMNEGKPMDYG